MTAAGGWTRAAVLGLLVAAVGACSDQDDQGPAPLDFGIHHGEPRPGCAYVIDEGRQPYLMPTVLAPDWGEPVKLGEPIATACPEDAVTISRDGAELYFYWSPTVGADAQELLRGTTGTYRAPRLGDDPGAFGPPTFFELRAGAREGASDGRLSFTPDGAAVFFHSTRWENTGYQATPPYDDYLDIYRAAIVGGTPGVAVNLGAPVNSVHRDGEHALAPDGLRLFFSSDRPGGQGGVDIWVSAFDGLAWSEPVNLGSPVNTPHDDLQPAFAAGDPHTLYLVSDRAGAGGIFRSSYLGDQDGWTEPEAVITGYVGEPSLVADGSLLYFVHVLVDDDGVFGADIWYVQSR
jgi:hypothetical protein